MASCIRNRASWPAAWLAVIALLGTSSAALAAAPSTIAVEGRLAGPGGGPVADGKYAVTFALYPAAGGGQAFWSETVADLTVKGGIFHHALGSKNALSAKTLAASKAAWLSLRVGNEPELARNAMHAAPYARRAAVAEGVKCTGCVSVLALKADGDLDLGGNALKAKLVTANNVQAVNISAQGFAGDGSKLTGIKLPSGTCAQGKVAIGIQADGKLSCATPAGQAAAALEQISGGLLTTAFAQPISSKNTPKAIEDNNPIGSFDEIDVPDIGAAKKLTVTVKISNSDLSGVEVVLYDPTNAKYVLHKGKPGKQLNATYPDPDKVVSGNLGGWVGKNPKGKWRLRVIDSKFLNNGKDGSLEDWSINILASVSKQVTSKGLFLAAGGFNQPDSAGPPFKCTSDHIGHMYFDTKNKGLYFCDGDWRRLLVNPLCGNKIINGGETCDDGNTKSGDGCTATCQKNVCGDGVVWTGKEECDDGNKVDKDACNNLCKSNIIPGWLSGLGPNNQNPTITIGTIAGKVGRKIRILKVGICGDSDSGSGPNRFRLSGGGLNFTWYCGQNNGPGGNHKLSPTPNKGGSARGFSYKDVKPNNYLSAVGASLTLQWDYHSDWDGRYCDDKSEDGKQYKDQASTVRAWVAYQYE